MKILILYIALLLFHISHASGQTRIVSDGPNRNETAIPAWEGPLNVISTKLNSNNMTIAPRILNIHLRCGSAIYDSTKHPLVLVDTFRTDLRHLIIDPNIIDSINIFNASQGILRFGNLAKDGVIIIHPKPGVTLLLLEDILKACKIPVKDQKLRVCINKIFMPEPQLILIEKSEIKKAEVITKSDGINIEDAYSGERFINIITRRKNK